ncbi:MAG: transketolase [candidate division WOR-3 bacterium]|uniref:Transketolase n=1 Tax=candidate division WOR-3 bacterium TaxID=2052148 RepID=A0A7V3ZSA5_UNCW3
MQRITFSEIETLQKIAKEIRKDIIKMTGNAGSGHPGGSLSCVEILVSLFFKVMRHDPKNPTWSERDRFILSKGHGAPALYATLAQCGYIEREELLTLRKIGSRLQGHPDKRFLPLLEVSTGSLGQGLSVGVGVALAGKIDKKDYRVYVLIGDGESQEGQVWEAAMFSSFHKLDNLCAIMDYNKFQLDGRISEILDIEPVIKKWQSFGWEVFEVKDGHNFEEILWAFEEAKKIKHKPQIIIAHTIKGKGVSFMEGNNHFHGRAPNKEEEIRALKEISEDL